MVEVTPDHLRALEALRETYSAQLPDRVRAIAAAGERFARGGWRAAAADELCQLAHLLAGSAAIYGFALTSAAARELELLALSACGAAAPSPSDREQRLRSLTAALLSASLQELAAPRPAWVKRGPGLPADAEATRPAGSDLKTDR